VIYTNEFQPDATFPELRTLDVRVLSRVPVDRSIGSVARAAARILSQRVDLSGFDAILVVCEGLGDLFVLRNHPVPAFCLCLTPLRIVFDPHYRSTYLADHGTSYRAAVWLGGYLFKLIDRLAWTRYRRIFAVSREVRHRIVDGRLAASARVELLHPGVDPSAFTPSARSRRTFFVPGRIMWTKNLELAIDAFREFRRRLSPDDRWRLCIAGIVDRKSEPYFERLRRASADDPIDFVVQPDDATLRRLYAESFATLFTAFNEDWGLVILESMAAGKPTIALNRGGPREIVEHERNGLLSDPTPGAFADAMVRLVNDSALYSRLSANGPTAAAKYNWTDFVSRLDDAVGSAVGATS
jgi:glycosyltransferase involved in cell wall biosynthesis